MRPPDENQRGSTRPNLLSGSRRAAAADDNILGRLEREAPYSLSLLSPGARLAWLALAGSLIIALIGALAWLANESASARALTVVAEAIPATGPASATPVAPRPGDFETGPTAFGAGTAPAVVGEAHASASSSGAAVIDEPTERVVVVAATPAAAPAAAPVPTLAPARAHAAASRGAPPLVMLRPAPPPPKAAAAAARSAVMTKAAPAKPAAAKAGAARTAQARPVAPKTSARTAAARTRKPKAAPPATETPPIDTDVALLSAIIMHSGKHAAERAQQDSDACVKVNKCGPKTAGESATSQETQN